MSSKTKIEWADRVWNPVVGCTPVSEGCRNCYARTLHNQRHEAFLHGKKMPEQYRYQFSYVQMLENRLMDPLHWKKPQRVFVNSMSDLFHPDVPVKFLTEVFETMASWVLICKDRDCDHAEETCWTRHQFMVLTKRPAAMYEAITKFIPQFVDEYFPGDSNMGMCMVNDNWPLKNLWLGVSVEDQQTADERIPWLLKTPAAVRFVSVEPMLGPVDLREYLTPAPLSIPDGEGKSAAPALDWVICGGESGADARIMDPLWPSALKNQCVAAGVPFFFKSWGEWGPMGGMMAKVGKHRSGRWLDDHEWNEFPEVK